MVIHADSSLGPIISVVTITRNDLDGLRNTVASVERQIYPLIQHVVVDGDSSDGTKEWLEKYKPHYLSTVISEPDEGIFDAMNKGIDLCAGDLIVFMNSGDAFADGGVLAMIAQDWSASAWSWAYGQMEYVNETGKIQGKTQQLAFSTARQSLGLIFAPHQSTYMTRDLIVTLGGFDTRFGFACDQELALRAGFEAPPKIFVDVLSRFLLGGAHSQSSYWHREGLYHQIRFENDCLLLDNSLLDTTYAYFMAAYREARESAGYLLKEVRGILDRTKLGPKF